MALMSLKEAAGAQMRPMTTAHRNLLAALKKAQDRYFKIQDRLYGSAGDALDISVYGIFDAIENGYWVDLPKGMSLEEYRNKMGQLLHTLDKESAEVQQEIDRLKRELASMLQAKAKTSLAKARRAGQGGRPGPK